MENTRKIESQTRRECLFWLMDALAITVIGTKNVVADTLEENKEIISRTISAVWKNELDFFIYFFWLTSENEEKIIDKVIQIQKETDLNEDGVIWDHTIAYIYKNYYAANREKLGRIQKERLKIAEDMQQYKEKQLAANGKKIKATNIPDVWNNNRFFWWENFEPVDLYEPVEENIYWKDRAYVSKHLFDSINWDEVKKIYQFRPNSVYIFQNGERFTLALFNKTWMLSILSSTSPWLDNFPSIAHKKAIPVKARPNINHVSSSYPEEIDEKNIWWAPMPYSVDIYGWYKIHGSGEIVDWKKRSHGCFRLPLYYAKEFYEYTKKYWPRLYIGDLWYNKK